MTTAIENSEDPIAANDLRSCDDLSSFTGEAENSSTPSTPGKRHLLVRVGNMTFAMSLENVRGVYRLPEYTPLPSHTPWLTGMATIGGRVLPIVDFAERMGMAAGERSQLRKIVDVEVGGPGSARAIPRERCAYVVDHVVGVREISAEVEASLGTEVDESTSILGVVDLDDVETLLVDLEALSIQGQTNTDK